MVYHNTCIPKYIHTFVFAKSKKTGPPEILLQRQLIFFIFITEKILRRVFPSSFSYGWLARNGLLLGGELPPMLRFIPKEEMEKEGYSYLLWLFK
jgi:hypothetical protein